MMGTHCSGGIGGGGKCEILQLMSQGTSEAQIKHKTITYDRLTPCQNRFLG